MCRPRFGPSGGRSVISNTSAMKRAKHRRTPMAESRPRNVLTDEPGAAQTILGHPLDVTDRMRAKGALRDSGEALKRAFAELDARVRERTAELRLANDRLRVEITDRERAEEMRERTLR